MIDPNKVEAAYKNSLIDGEAMEYATVVEGVLFKHAFFQPRLNQHREQVVLWLAELPSEFHADGGGGWSFLNACNTKDGEQWTGLHLRMDQLFAMGQALGLVKLQLPREMWAILPGGMPYYGIDLRAENQS